MLFIQMLTAVTATSIGTKNGPQMDAARRGFQLHHHLSVCCLAVLYVSLRLFHSGIEIEIQLHYPRHTRTDNPQDFQDAISSLERARQPVICAMHGYALGLAIDIASACDIRVAASDVRMGIQVCC
jgi:enoyl-CoA hydratase/carnithine racemase